VLAPVVEQLRKLASRHEPFKLEWDAVEYLISGDRTLGRATVEAALALLQKSELPDRNDACRVTGRIMVTGAIVYDWLYPLITEEEKQEFIRELIRLAKTLECGYPPTRQGSVTGHSSEAMIMRDMISAGIAIYDEYPEMYDLAAGRFFREHLPARNWLYHGHAYHQGDSYGPYRFSWDTFPLWIFDRLGAGNIYNPDQSQVPYLWVYKTRPDGQRLRSGDTFMHSRPRGTPWGVGSGAMLTASYYGDGTLLSHYLAQGGNRDNEVIFEYLWRDVDLQPKPIGDLPCTRYFGPPFGWMVARTGWDERSVIAEMKINEINFTNHQHLDAGAFQIYYQGALAIDSGVYTGSAGRYGSPHCRNYYWRTIAHNCLLIYDPEEQFQSRSGYGNDGGQRLPNARREPKALDVLLNPENGYRTGKVLAQGFGPNVRTPDYSLLKGDITVAYSNKVREVVRSFVFLNLRNEQVPAALVVFDRVVSRYPDFKKYWLLHALEEPQISESGITIMRSEHGQRGRLVLNTLLPKPTHREIEKIGGPGKEFRVFGKNFTNYQEPGRLERSSMELGSWRVQISPKKASTENLLLNVMQVADGRSSRTFPVEHVNAGPWVGCRIDGPKSDWVVLFQHDGRCANGPVSFHLPGEQPCRILVTDLEPGAWQAKHSSGEVVSLRVSRDSAAAWLQGQAGAWTLSKLTGN
jgi:heparin/heparan-sulfate lyase